MCLRQYATYCRKRIGDAAVSIGDKDKGIPSVRAHLVFSDLKAPPSAPPTSPPASPLSYT